MEPRARERVRCRGWGVLSHRQRARPSRRPRQTTDQRGSSARFGRRLPARRLHRSRGRQSHPRCSRSAQAVPRRRSSSKATRCAASDRRSIATSRWTTTRSSPICCSIASSATASTSPVPSLAMRRIWTTGSMTSCSTSSSSTRPCTGLGTLRRHPEIRWRLTDLAVAEHAELNVKMLESAATRVAPGGALVYATCTVTPEENARVVSSFLKSEAGSGLRSSLSTVRARSRRNISPVAATPISARECDAPWRNASGFARRGARCPRRVSSSKRRARLERLVPRLGFATPG